MPRMAPLRKMFSRPVSSGWKPVPTSSRLATRPRSVTRPFVGSVMRLNIFSKVLLPAPLRPMTPRTSPCSTSKLTSLSAQNSSTSSPWTISLPRNEVDGLAGEVASLARHHVAQRGIPLALGGPMSNQVAFRHKFSTLMIGLDIIDADD